MRLSTRLVIAFLKIYVAGALFVAALLSPVALSFVPASLLVWYLVEWRWRFSTFTDVMTKFFVFYALAILFAPSIGLWLSLAVALPSMVGLNYALEENARIIKFIEGKTARRFTGIWFPLLAIVLGVFLLALLLGSIVLILSDSIVAFYFIYIGIYSWKHFPVKPVTYEQVQSRCIVGKTEHLQILLTSMTKSGGTLYIKSPYDWLKVNPHVLSFREEYWPLKLIFTPPLSGPGVITLKGYAVDRWGLIQTNFEIEPVTLIVIPKATYAAWLARKYLANTSPSNLPIVSNITSVKSLFGLRSGVEYYGNQSYQPGDSLKNIDWKHSIKFNELIVKEFTESHSRPAILLANLTASDLQEADNLAYDLIVAAISLAREGIPTSLGAYNSERILLTTPPLHGADLVLHSLQMLKQIHVVENPSRYLKPPDIRRLRTNLARLKLVGSGSSGALAALLQVEYQSLSDNARSHPCTLALAEVKAKSNQQCVVLSVSQRNHDSEALDFNSYIFAKKGNAIIQIKQPS